MRILLVEDHPDLAANVADYLHAHGRSVVVAGDGERALTLLRRQTFGVIVIDRMLPGLDGASLCRSIRAGPHATVPVLMLTAMDTVADKLAGFDAGADDYLVKPFALAELAARIAALARRGARREANLLQVADLTYDLDTREAQRAGKPVHLNPTTRAILEILMRETHRVVTREELARGVWGKAAPTDGLLRVHMYALRAAIDRGHRRKLVRTVHSVGYRLVDAQRA